MKPVVTLLILLALCALPATGQTPKSNDCSMGVWPWLVKNINSDIPKIVADTKSYGMETIYISVFRVQGRLQGDLPMEDESGRWQTAWGTKSNYLRLSTLISQAHAAGLQVVGVMSCFKNVEPTDAAHANYLVDIIGYFFDHFRQDGTPYYDLDGICLDYVRFSSGYNRNPKYVNDFLDKIKARFPLVPLHAYVIANAYSYDGPVYDNNFRSYASVIGTISGSFGQNYEQMAKRLDVIMPMSYVSDGGVYGSNRAHMKGYVKKVAEYVRRAMTIGGSPYTKVIPTIKNYGTATAATVQASTEGAMEGSAHGVSTFRYYSGSASQFAAIAKYTMPGTNRPVAGLTLTGVGQTCRLDSSTSRDGQDPASKLQVRYDLDGDGTLDTALLPVGKIDLLTPAPGTRIVTMEVRDTEGHWARTRREVYLPNSLTMAFPLLSVANGGLLKMPVKLGPGGAGRLYVLLASLTGTSPGMPLSSMVTLPLVYDSMTWTSAFMAGGPIFPSSFGFATAAGDATPAFKPGPGQLPTAMVGLNLHFAAAVFNPTTYVPEAATNPVKVYLVP